jgi:hypothetical protein
MNSFTGAFSIYEILRILIPGFYFVLMLENVFSNISKKINCGSIDTYPTLLFIIISIVLGAMLYAMDIPRWFKKCYSTLPSNLIKENKDELVLLGLAEDNSRRPFEDIYYQFYYSRQSPLIFKTEIQSGFFHLLMTMSFIGIIIIIIHATVMALSIPFRDYYFINLFITIISVIGTIIIYKVKLRYSWKRNYEEFVDNLKKEKCKKK